MVIIEVVSGGDRRSLMKRFERKSKQQAISELVDFHLLNCDRIEKLEAERDSALARVAEMKTMADNYCALLMDANAKLAEMDRQEPVALANRGLHAFWVKWTEASADLYGPGLKLYAYPVAHAQAQHSVPEEFSFEYRHPNGESHTVTVSRDQVINEMPDFLFEALCSKFCNCEPAGETNVVECCCDEYAEEFKLLAAAPGKGVDHE